jgi:hypothetical protein
MVLGLALGCGTADGGPELLRDDIPDPPPGGVQFATPIFEIPAGEEVFMCMRVPFEVDREMFVQSSRVFQADAGHHTLVFYSENSEGVNPEPHECDGFEMTDVRIVTTGTADGVGLTMPEGVVLAIPEGAEIWVQSHYINATEKLRRVQDVVNLELIEPDEVRQVAGTFAQVDLTFTLAPQAETTRVLECQIPHEMTVPWILPHMHEWGKSFKIEVLEDDETVYELSGDWFESARDDFPIEQLDEYLELGPQHTVRTTCHWFNDGAEPLLFPQEMCVTFFPYFPGDGSLLACDETGRTFEP